MKEHTSNQQSYPGARLAMSLSRSLWIIAMAGVLNITLPTCASPPIERLQRELQARYYFLTTNYYQWPDCMGGNKAPAFPKDGFYGDISRDPEQGVRLVRDAWSKLYGSVQGRLFYSYFIDTPDGKVSNIPQKYIVGGHGLGEFPFFDFPPVNVLLITKETYLSYLNTFLEQVKKLQWVVIDNRLSDDPFGNYGVNALSESILLGAIRKQVSVGTNTRTDCAYVKLLALDALSRAPGNPNATIGLRLGTHGGSDCATFPSSGGAEIDQKCGGESCNLTARRYHGGTGWVLSLATELPYPEDCVSPQAGNGHHPLYEAFFGKHTPTPETGPPVDLDGVLHVLEMKDGTPCQLFGGSIFHSDAYACGDLSLDINWPSCTHGDGWDMPYSVGTFKPVFHIQEDKEDCCGCACEFGTSVAKDGCVQFKVNFGPGDYGRSAGYLLLQESEPTDILANRLRYSVSGTVSVYPPDASRFSDVQRLYFQSTSNMLQFIRNPDLKTVETRYYQNQPPTALSSGASGNPSKSITVYNPGGNTNLIQTFETSAGPTRMSQYTWASSSGVSTWELTTGGPTLDSWLRKETSQSTKSGDDRTEDYRIINPGNVTTVYKEIRQYKKYDFGEKLLQSVIDPDGAALTTTYVYYTTGGKAGQVRQVTYPDGFWERFDYDGYGRLTLAVTPFKDNLINSLDSLNRKTVVTYEDNGDYTSTDYLQDVPISKTTVRFSSLGFAVQRREIRFYDPNALETDSRNLVTVTQYLWGQPEGMDVLDWEPTQIEYPDGTMEIRSHSIDFLFSHVRYTTILSGEANDTKSGIVNGTFSQERFNAGGYPEFKWAGLLRDTEWRVTTTYSTYSNHDPFFRPRRVDYLDGTFTLADYGCCGTDTFTDKDGVVTSRISDGLNRPTKFVDVTHGITTRNVLDAADNIVATTRTGSDTTIITQFLGKYDRAQRLIAESRPLNGVTAHSYPNGGSVHQITYTNGSVRVESHYLDRQLKDISGTATHPMSYDYGLSSAGLPYALAKKGPANTEVILTEFDFLGRPQKTSYPGAFEQSVFDNKGRLAKWIDADGVTSLFGYDSQSRLATNGVDLDHNGLFNFGGTDRISSTEESLLWKAITPDVTAYVQRFSTRVWSGNGDANTAPTVTMFDVSPFSTNLWQSIVKDDGTPLTTAIEISYSFPAYGTRTVTQSFPDNSGLVALYTYGRLTSVARTNANGLQLTKTSYDYDPHGRLWKIIDSRNGATVTTYNNADQKLTVSTPAPGTGQPAQVTRFYYDRMGWLTNIVQQDGASITNAYTLRGELAGTWGSRVYPVGYEYDSQGRLRHMTNWGTFSTLSTPRITEWNYNGGRGWLDNKRYPDANTGLPSALGPTYTYTPGGRLQTRTWARNITTTYAYNLAGANWGGDLQTVTYGDTSTPNLAFQYDRRGRAQTVTQTTQGAGSTDRITTLGFNNINQSTGESITDAGANQPGMSLGYDDLQRRLQFNVTGINSSATIGYGYDEASRLGTVTMGSSTATYSYLADSPLIEKTEFRDAGQLRMTTTQQFDKLNRLTSIASTRPSGNGVPPLPTFGYTYNDANQRVSVTTADGSYWVYEYDRAGQIKSARKYWPFSEFVAGQQFDYAFDDIGNRTTTLAGRDQFGANPRTINYTPNRLNQYVSRTVPALIDIMGVARADASVTTSVNGDNVVPYRHGEYYRREAAVDNANPTPHPAYPSVTVNATLNGTTDTVNRHEYLPPSLETFVFDNDGNLKSDGRWNYTWDAENRLISMETLGSAQSSGVPYRKLIFRYDWRGRRIGKQVWTTQLGPPAQLRFVYDGRNLAAEVDVANNLVRSYAWGLDLSGSRQGAGGVGGLLAVNVQGAGVQFASYDGNGNVAALMQAVDGTVTANYEYGPFGELIRSSGVLGESNPFRFSTKYLDAESGLSYYGNRYYDSSTGRWLGRDKIQEYGGLNLYGFNHNNPVKYFDPDGNGIMSWLCGDGWDNRDYDGAFWGSVGNSAAEQWSEIKDGISAARPGQGAWTQLDSDFNDHYDALAAEYGKAQTVIIMVDDLLGITSITEGTSGYSIHDLEADGQMDSVTRWSEGLQGAGQLGLLIAPKVVPATRIPAPAILDRPIRLPRIARPREPVPQHPPCECQTPTRPANPSQELLDELYPRPTYRPAGFHDAVAELNIEDGKLIDPLGQVIKPVDYWELGHKPGHKFSDMQRRAYAEDWDDNTWKQYQQDPYIYRPERRYTNRSHRAEDEWFDVIGNR